MITSDCDSDPLTDESIYLELLLSASAIDMSVGTPKSLSNTLRKFDFYSSWSVLMLDLGGFYETTGFSIFYRFWRTLTLFYLGLLNSMSKRPFLIPLIFLTFGIFFTFGWKNLRQTAFILASMGSSICFCSFYSSTTTFSGCSTTFSSSWATFSGCSATFSGY